MSIRLADMWGRISWEDMGTILSSPFINPRNKREVVSEQKVAICGSSNNQQVTGASLTCLS